MTDTALIQLEDVSIRHGAHVILQDIQAEVGEGELVYLIGLGNSSGGFSTIVKVKIQHLHWYMVS